MWGNLEGLCDLFFELSNEERMKILRELQKGSANITRLSRAMDISTQEVSRHVSRLVECDVVSKDGSGAYWLTPFGDLVLSQIQGLSFASVHREYFKDHALSDLPANFLCRIGELGSCDLVDDVMVVFHNVERLIEEAEEYIWRLTDRYNMMSLPHLEAATERGVQFRLLQTKGFEYPPEWPGAGEVMSDSRLKGTLKVKISDSANVFIAMSEKEVAIVAFPSVNDRFDYLGFTSGDRRFHGWCAEVFQFYWERARFQEGFTE
jgi:predicted transcriptional regulator